MIPALAIVVTRRCSYSCAYCPREASVRELSGEVHGQIACALAGLADTICFTGGEPLLRVDLAALVAVHHAASPRARLVVETNGLLLGDRVVALRAAGLDDVVVHLDTLRPDRYRPTMGGRDLSRTIAHVLRARDTLGAATVSLVVQRGRNDDELLDVLSFWSRHGVGVRFDELTPAAHARFVAAREIVERLDAESGPEGAFLREGLRFEVRAGAHARGSWLDVEGTLHHPTGATPLLPDPEAAVARLSLPTRRRRARPASRGAESGLASTRNTA